MFSRQWFPPGSQIGLEEAAILFEKYLRKKDIKSCRKILNSTTHLSDSQYWERQNKRLRSILFRNQFWPLKSDVRVQFYNFWPDFCQTNNQLLSLLRSSFENQDVVLAGPDEPVDIAVCSCYGNTPLPRNTQGSTRLLFLGENVRPYYRDYDLSVSFDINSYRSRNIHLPLCMFEVDYFDETYPDRKPFPIHTLTNDLHYLADSRSSSVVYIGNNSEPFRETILNALQSNGIRVDRYGSHTNPVEDKISLLQKYKVCVAFENSYYPGYITEKLVHGLLAGTHTLYWGGTYTSHPLLQNSHTHFVDTNDSIEMIIKKVRFLLSSSGHATREALFTPRFLSTQLELAKIQIKKYLAMYLS